MAPDSRFILYVISKTAIDIKNGSYTFSETKLRELESTPIVLCGQAGDSLSSCMGDKCLSIYSEIANILQTNCLSCGGTGWYSQIRVMIFYQTRRCSLLSSGTRWDIRVGTLNQPVTGSSPVRLRFDTSPSAKIC